MNRPSFSAATVVKLVLASLVIGLVLSVLDVDPEALLENIGGTVQKIFEVLVSLIEWTIPYILLGAVVVVPIWLILVSDCTSRVAWRN